MMDDEVFSLIEKEKRRQAEYLALIPSENYASRAVRQAVGSVMMNKYSEGQVGKRYYQGNLVVDEVEVLCKKRALQLFKLDGNQWGVNVQAHSGSPANLAVYNGLLEPGDRIMSMFLPDGGHLSHGWHFGGKRVTFVSKVWEVKFYQVDATSKVFDYDKLEKEAEEFLPRLIISGGTAYPREIDHKRMGEIAKKVRAYYMADIAHEAGLVAGGVNQSPFPFAEVVTMTTHKTLRGPRGAMIFGRKDIEKKNGESLMEAIDRSVFPGLQGGPHNHTIAGIAVSLSEALKPEFAEYSRQIIANAQKLAEVLSGAGFEVVSGGTDKHVVLVDLRNKGVSGWVVAWALEYAGIVANRNTVPGETASPYYPSGLRLGTPAVTTRGMTEKEMEQIGKWIIQVVEQVKHEKLPEDKEERRKFVEKFLERVKEDKVLAGIRKEVRELCGKFPVEQ